MLQEKKGRGAQELAATEARRHPPTLEEHISHSSQQLLYAVAATSCHFWAAADKLPQRPCRQRSAAEVRTLPQQRQQLPQDRWPLLLHRGRRAGQQLACGLTGSPLHACVACCQALLHCLRRSSKQLLTACLGCRCRLLLSRQPGLHGKQAAQRLQAAGPQLVAVPCRNHRQPQAARQHARSCPCPCLRCCCISADCCQAEHVAEAGQGGCCLDAHCQYAVGAASRKGSQRLLWACSGGASKQAGRQVDTQKLEMPYTASSRAATK